jgi:hypothetical protein
MYLAVIRTGGSSCMNNRVGTDFIECFFQLLKVTKVDSYDMDAVNCNRTGKDGPEYIPFVFCYSADIPAKKTACACDE